MLNLRLTLLLLCLLVATSQLRAETIVGTCTNVSDGDTLTLSLADGSQRTIRLYGIDAPEKQQEFGASARERLAELVLEQQLTADVRGTDRYGRSLARIYSGDIDITLSLVQQGYAWHYVVYAPNDFDLAEAEALAAANHLGLWQQEKPISLSFSNSSRMLSESVTSTPSLIPFTPVSADFQHQTGHNTATKQCSGLLNLLHTRRHLESFPHRKTHKNPLHQGQPPIICLQFPVRWAFLSANCEFPLPFPDKSASGF